jgi:hypothetical protein
MSFRFVLDAPVSAAKSSIHDFIDWSRNIVEPIWAMMRAPKDSASSMTSSDRNSGEPSTSMRGGKLRPTAFPHNMIEHVLREPECRSLTRPPFFMSVVLFTNFFCGTPWYMRDN